MLRSELIARLAQKARAAGIHLDISARKELEAAQTRAQRELQAKQQALDEAQTLAHLGFWERDIVTDEEHWSDEQCRIFGFDPDAIKPTYAIFLAALHPDDRKKVQQAVDASVLYDLPYNIDCRIIRPSGEVRHINCRGIVRRRPDGSPVSMTGTVQDITEHKRAESAWRESETRMRSVFESAVEGIVVIEAAAREPGRRSKIAVSSRDGDVDPVGACVGIKGSRVQAVVQELQGEKVDIIPWSGDTANFIVNALAPAEVTKVVLDEDSGRIEVVVPDDQLSLAIGRRGQNVRLASQLTGFDIDILTDAQESERRQEEFKSRSQTFMDALDVDDVIAHLLVTEGFASVEEVAFVPTEDLAGIEGFDADVAEELKARAQAWIEAESERSTAKRKEMGVTDEVAAIDKLTPPMLVALGEKGVKTLDDLADLAADELVDPKDGILKEFDLTADDANAIIMAARAHWFEDGK